MNARIALCVAAALLAAPVFAQTGARAQAPAQSRSNAEGNVRAPVGQLRLPEFAGLAQKASETVTVTLDPNMLRFAASWLNENDADQAKAKKLVTSLSGIYVRSFSFDTDVAFPKAEVDAVRNQLAAPGWSRMVEVRSKQNANVDVYMNVQGDRVQGLAVIATEPRQFTVVNIVGDIDFEQLRDIQGQFGVPNLDLEKVDAPPLKKPK
jgi:hypothetical protein